MGDINSENNGGFSFDEILQLIDKVSNSKLDEFRLTTDRVKIDLKKNKQKIIETVSTSVPAIAVSNTIENKQETGDTAFSQDADDIYTVKSPIVGTFYASKEEGGEPLVKVGDKVKKDSIVAIIEAMKLMNEITAGADGVVEEIIVDNGELVEYGQVLMKIKF